MVVEKLMSVTLQISSRGTVLFIALKLKQLMNILKSRNCPVMMHRLLVSMHAKAMMKSELSEIEAIVEAYR